MEPSDLAETLESAIEQVMDLDAYNEEVEAATEGRRRRPSHYN
jgi:hypothetical protein